MKRTKSFIRYPYGHSHDLIIQCMFRQQRSSPHPGSRPATELSDYHFDIFMTIGKHGGMNQGDGTIVKSVNTLRQTWKSLT